MIDVPDSNLTHITVYMKFNNAIDNGTVSCQAEGTGDTQSYDSITGPCFYDDGPLGPVNATMSYTFLGGDPYFGVNMRFSCIGTSYERP
jgi:hypothetical protein